MTRLQELRKQIGLTQEEMSSKLGISQQAYGNYEKEGFNIPSKMVEKIADILMVDPSEITYTNELENNTITEFLYKSLTSYHAVKNSISLLEKDGFIELKEDEKWNLKEGGKYYITKNSSAIISFKVNDLSHYAFNIASCHTDSPSLKVKGNSLLPSPEGKRINVEKYGGLINYSFMNIPLKIAGRVLLEKENGLESRIISSSFKVNVPSICIHHAPTVNDGIELNYQNDMLPLIGDVEDLYSVLLPNEKIIDADLYCVPAVKPTYSGFNNDLLVSPRIDNLASLYAITNALIDSNGTGISICYATDNEEIGSLSKQGAESMFLTHVLERINAALDKTNDDYYKAISNGFVLSIDGGHAVHQAHPEKSDPDHKVYLNKGIVIKHHPNYSTDGLSSSIVKSIAKANNIEVQDYYNNSNVRCGSTIGLVTSAQLAINACDVGLAQLAMHSAIETVGKKDIEKMTQLVRSFYQTKIEINGNNVKLN